MRRSLWAMAAIGLAAVLVMMIGSQSMIRTTSGVEEALGLQQILRSSYRGVFAQDPPVRVQRVPSSDAWPVWRWRVEGTVMSKMRNPATVDRTVNRIVFRCLSTSVQGRGPGGVMVVLHGQEGERVLYFDGEGRRTDAGGRPPPPRETPR